MHEDVPTPVRVVYRYDGDSEAMADDWFGYSVSLSDQPEGWGIPTEPR